MKPFLVFIMLLVGVVFVSAQSPYRVTRDKSITSAYPPDSIQLSNSVYELTITNRSMTDTLIYRFDTPSGAKTDTTWAYLFPLQNVHFERILLKKIFRRSLGSSIFSQLWAN